MLAWNDSAGLLWVVRGSGKPERLLDAGAYDEGDKFWDWAPWGHRLVAKVDKRVIVVDAVTARRKDVTPSGGGEYSRPLWSPSGRIIAYVRQTRGAARTAA